MFWVRATKKVVSFVLLIDMTVITFIFQLKTVEALLGSTAKLGEVIVLGMITQLKEVIALPFMTESLHSNDIKGYKSSPRLKHMFELTDLKMCQ